MRILSLPFRLGDDVRVLPSVDETFNRSFIGKIGQVIKFDFDCKCGQSYPDDPMIGVEFPSGRYEEFWREELELLRAVQLPQPFHPKP